MAAVFFRHPHNSMSGLFQAMWNYFLYGFVYSFFLEFGQSFPFDSLTKIFIDRILLRNLREPKIYSRVWPPLENGLIQKLGQQVNWIFLLWNVLMCELTKTLFAISSRRYGFLSSNTMDQPLAWLLRHQSLLSAILQILCVSLMSTLDMQKSFWKFVFSENLELPPPKFFNPN